MQTYTAEIDDLYPEDTPVWGCGCENLKLRDLDEIGDCSLTPGDPSPAGRCPHCDGLCYIDTPEARAMNEAERLVKMARGLLEAFPEGMVKIGHRLTDQEAATINGALLVAEATVATVDARK